LPSMGMTAAALPTDGLRSADDSDLTSTLIGKLVVLAAFQALTIYGSQLTRVFRACCLVLTVLIAPERASCSPSYLISRLVKPQQGRRLMALRTSQR